MIATHSSSRFTDYFFLLNKSLFDKSRQKKLLFNLKSGDFVYIDHLVLIESSKWPHNNEPNEIRNVYRDSNNREFYMFYNSDTLVLNYMNIFYSEDPFVQFIFRQYLPASDYIPNEYTLTIDFLE
jgi:hypothetical protein